MNRATRYWIRTVLSAATLATVGYLSLATSCGGGYMSISTSIAVSLDAGQESTALRLSSEGESVLVRFTPGLYVVGGDANGALSDDELRYWVSTENWQTTCPAWGTSVDPGAIGLGGAGVREEVLGDAELPSCTVRMRAGEDLSLFVGRTDDSSPLDVDVQASVRDDAPGCYAEYELGIFVEEVP